MIIQDWINQNRLDAIIWDSQVFSIKDIGKFIIVGNNADEILFDQKFELQLSQQELDRVLEDEEIIYFAFEFGNKWYYTDDQLKPQLKELKYLGTEIDQFEDAPPFLAIHGGYDLCNGSRSYDDWCKKAKFCGYKILGIAEENTLAGVLAFQNACEKNDIKPIIGETVTVQDKEGDEYKVKLYCFNDEGWKNLLLINAQINVFNNKFVTEEYLLQQSTGLSCVLSPEVNLGRKVTRFKKAQFTQCYFQFDISQWDSDERDKQMLLATQAYLSKHNKELLPVLLSDAYYLDQEDARIRKDLNAIGKVAFKNQSRDQWFKTPNELFVQIASLFTPEDDKFLGLAEQSMNSAKKIGESEFKIETGKLHLPLYEMSEEQEAKYGNIENMFWSLIEEGLQIKVINRQGKNVDLDKYTERIQQEADVILGANLHSYFLITWDLLHDAHEKGALTGYGRGSAAGCLIAFLMNIVQTDPFDYGLLFERFLNEGRLYKKKKVAGKRLYFEGKPVGEAYVIGTDEYYAEMDEWDKKLEYDDYELRDEEIETKVTGSMPDIDNDVQGEKRDDIKRYMEEKYGKDRVASIGTYSTFKVKGVFKALARRSGADSAYTNYVTGAIKDDDLDFTELFKYSNEVEIVKKYMQENYELIEKIPLILNQPVTASMHAAGMIIVPKSKNGIYDQLPVKLVDGVLLSEWEDDYVEQAGFLKLDLLGLKQLDKFADILNLIIETQGDCFELTDIPLDDPKVYETFSKGQNEDVFQFGGFGLKGYTAELKPETINDLIATVALYRPGPIDTGAHMRYIHRKNRSEEPSYIIGTEEVLNETYGLMVYQEQVMKMTQSLAGFTLNEADDVRKAIGKKIPELMKQQKDKFIERAVANGYPQNEMEWLWDEIEVFAGYSFNKSHAACYAITGYHCQWFKVNYPLQFWTVSLRHATDDQRQNRLAEIYSSSNINIAPVDINKSTMTFECDVDTNTIYWTIFSVKQVGEAAVKAILEERALNGEYFSIEEFTKRLKPFGKAVKKNTITNLILAGAFDSIYKVKSPTERFSILEKYLTFMSSKIEDEEILKMKKWKEYHWILKQRELSGIGVLNFKKLIHHSNLVGKIDKYLSNQQILETTIDELPNEVLIGGIVSKFEMKGTGKQFATVEITDGQTILSGVIWNDIYTQHIDLFKESPVDKLIVLTATIKYDQKFKKANVFNTLKQSSITIID